MPSEPTIVQTAEFNPSIKTYIVLVGAIFLTISVVGIPLLLIWLLGVGKYFSKRYYDNLECRLTEKHLEFKKGIFFRVEKTIPLENIQDLTFNEDPLLRYLDLRVLKIETAGQSNPGGSDMKLMGIIDSRGFKRNVLNQRTLLQNESRPSTDIPLPESEQIVLLKEIRDILIDLKEKI